MSSEITDTNLGYRYEFSYLCRTYRNFTWNSNRTRSSSTDGIIRILQWVIRNPLNLAARILIISSLSSHLLPDPTQFEFELCTTHISITLASDSTDLLNLYQVGAPLKSTTEGGKTSQELLQECITLARARAEQVLQILAV